MNLTYKGTQLTTSSIRPNFPPEVDVQPNVPAYSINIGGSDTINRIRVERPVSSDNRTVRLVARGTTADLTFQLQRRNEIVFTQELNTRGTGNPNDTSVTFSLVGNPTDYAYRIILGTSNVRVRRVGVINRDNASIAGQGRSFGRFSSIIGDFGLRIEIGDV